MTQNLFAISLLVPDYDEAIDFFCGKLGWHLAEDVDQGDKRWVRVHPRAAHTAEPRTGFILARAASAEQQAAIGNQFAGRVGLFLHTDDFYRDYNQMRDNGILFEEPPREEPYGIVAVWQDPFGNRWDLLELKSG